MYVDITDSKPQEGILFFKVGAGLIDDIRTDLLSLGIKIFQVDNIKEAQKTLKVEKINFVIVDNIPGDANGEDFLKFSKKNFPLITRISFVKEENKKEVIQLVVKGLITNYFIKNSDKKSFINGIQHILYSQKTLNNKKLQKIIENIHSLPVFPEIYQKFLDGIEKDKSLKDIASIIEKDISMTMRVLKVANSGFFKRGEFGSLERAAVYMGLEMVKNLFFTVALSSMKRLSGTQKKYLEGIVFHSAQVNQNFQKIFSQKTGGQIDDRYKTIGLTHDVGKIIMLQYFPGQFRKILNYQKKNPEVDFYRSELELGFEGQTHAEIGAYFLNYWNFPEASVFTALFHHSIEEFSEPYKDVLEIFSVVNEISKSDEIRT